MQRQICKELQRLPKNIRNKLFDNSTLPLGDSVVLEYKETPLTLGTILNNAFIWQESPEGHEYWLGIRRKYG